jgi:hypothetical protein
MAINRPYPSVRRPEQIVDFHQVGCQNENGNCKLPGDVLPKYGDSVVAKQRNLFEVSWDRIILKNQQRID